MSRFLSRLFQKVSPLTDSTAPPDPAETPATPQASSPQAASPQVAKTGDPAALSLPLLRDLATGLWRVRNALNASEDSESDRLAKAERALARIWDRLAENGMEIRDQVGADFDSGMMLTALAFQPTEGLEREVILETICPTIALAGHCLQVGEVIVGTPIEPPPEAQTEPLTEEASPTESTLEPMEPDGELPPTSETSEAASTPSTDQSPEPSTEPSTDQSPELPTELETDSKPKTPSSDSPLNLEGESL